VRGGERRKSSLSVFNEPHRLTGVSRDFSEA
jgi:hypothetical protein